MNKTLFVALAVTALAAGAQAQLVYDALSTGATVAYTHMAASATSSIEAGDQVQLGGGVGATLTSMNCVIQFTTATGDTNNFIINDTITFRSVTGTGSTATVNTGTPIYQATFALGGATGLAAGAWNFGFTLPSLVVPNEFIVTNTFTRQTGSNQGAVGEHFNNSAAAVGTSDPTYFWWNNPTWGHVNFGATPSGNMRMSLTGTPVPEPASMAVLGLGALGLLRRRSKKA
jgi:hypothetical protein